MSRKSRIRKKRTASIRAGLAKRLVALERGIDPIEKSLAEVAERAGSRLIARQQPVGLAPFEPEEAEVVIVRLAAPRRKPRWSQGDERQRTLASRLQKSPPVPTASVGPTGDPLHLQFDGHEEEASVVIVVPAHARALPPPLPDRNRDI